MKPDEFWKIYHATKITVPEEKGHSMEKFKKKLTKFGI